MTTTYSESLDASVKAAQDAARASYANKPQLEDIAAQAAASQAAAESASASASSAASDASAAQASAAASAALVGAPADSAIATAVSSSGTATRAALGAAFSQPAVVMVGAGIDPSGATSSASAIQAKLDAAAPGSDVYLPAGTFLGNFVVSVADVTIIGRGSRSTILRRNGTGPLLQISAPGVTVSNVRLDGQGATTGGGSVLKAVSAGSGAVVDSCMIEGASSANPHTVESYANDFTVRNSEIHGSACITNADNGIIQGNRFYAPSVTGASYGAQIRALTSGTNHADNNRIVNNYFEIPASQFAISPISRNGAIRPRGTVISGNVMVAVGDAFGGMSIDTCADATVTGNVFRVASGVPTIAALEIVQSYNVTASGNDFDGGGVLTSPIVSINRSSDCTIMANTLRNVEPTGFFDIVLIAAPLVGTKSDRNIVANNKIIIPGTANSWAVHISTNASGTTADGNIIAGNHVYGNSQSRGISIDNNSATSITGTTIAGNVIDTALYGFLLKNDSGTMYTGNRTVNVATRFNPPSGTGGAGIQLVGNDWQFATAAPSAGYHFAGERVLNSAPAVGSPQGWVCTVSGSPGTWVAMGNL